MDITERKSVEQELKRSLATVEQRVAERTAELSAANALLQGEIDRSARAQAELLRSQTLLDDMGRMARVGGWEVDLATGGQRWTAEVFSIHELDPSAGAPPASEGIRYYAPSAQPVIQAALGAAVRDGEPFDVELEFVTAKGNLRWVRAIGQPRRSGGKVTHVAGTFQDITDRKRIEEQLRQTEKLAALGQLAGGIAHDFNNALAAILGFADLLQQRLEEPGLRRYATNICVSARRSADLTGQLLAFARKGRNASVPTDLHEIIFEVADMLGHSIDKRIEIKQRLDAESAMVLGDPAQMQNAVLNLALNARDAMPRGGVLTFATRVVSFDTPSVEEGLSAGRYLQVSVEDTGEGMEAETVRHVFEPFFTTKAVGRGTGLGLASVYGAVKSHGGAVRCLSEPGRGSIFIVHLPLLEATMPGAAPEAEVASSQNRGRLRILVVDDEPMVLAVVKEMLEGVGYRVIACGDPVEALEAYRKELRSIDLVILDMVMPKMDGRTLFRAMQRENPGIRALISSGYVDSGQSGGMLVEGALGLLQKPFELNVLLSRIAEVMSPEQGTPRG